MVTHILLIILSSENKLKTYICHVFNVMWQICPNIFKKIIQNFKSIVLQTPSESEDSVSLDNRFAIISVNIGL